MGATRVRGVLVLGCLAAALAPAAAAEAAFPGANGRIAFSSNRAGTFDIWSMNPDGSDLAQLTNDLGYESAPVWSPDGTRIAFSRGEQIWVMDADGGDQTQLTTGPRLNGGPGWSPDGARIAFTARTFMGTGTFDVMVMDAGGTNVTTLVGGPEDDHTPAWAPDGTRIAFNSERSGNTRVYLVNPDGTHLNGFAGTPSGLFNPEWSPDAAWIAADNSFIIKISRDRTQRITLSAQPGGDFDAAWSPDNTAIAFDSNRGPGTDLEIWSMGADGSDPAALTANDVTDFAPDWQPIPINAYPRPKGAGLTRVSLTPAYAPCTSPNRTHGPPLAFGSCTPPAQRSGELTVGTPEANGNPAKSLAYLLFEVQAGLPATPEDEADVTLRAEITDVRRSSDLSDYPGALEARVGLTITDRDNSPSPGGPGAATTVEIPFSFQVPCASTADKTVGSTCSIDTTADALVPATVKEGDRSVWQLGAVEVRDAAGAAFMTQGVFIP